jgi:hypothetical protein
MTSELVSFLSCCLCIVPACLPACLSAWYCTLVVPKSCEQHIGISKETT